MYFKFKATATIASYWPQLLKKEWWLGYQNPETGTVALLPEGKDSLPSGLSGLVIGASDIEAQTMNPPRS